MVNGNILAFDYGDSRIGVAVGHSQVRIAHPLTTISGNGMWPKIDQIAPLIAKWQPVLLVVGEPSAHPSLHKQQLLNTINNFTKRLARKFNLPITLVGEDFTSSHASSLLTEQGVYGRAQQGKLDQLAAVSILNSYFQLCYNKQSTN